MAVNKLVSVSIPVGLVGQIDYIAGRLGISRSGFIAQLLLEADIDSLCSLLRNIPEQPSEGDLKRFRGDSRAYFAEQLSRLQDMQGGLFDDSAD